MDNWNLNSVQIEALGGALKLIDRSLHKINPDKPDETDTLSAFVLLTDAREVIHGFVVGEQLE
jgi:hypothetical protein